ncbi:MAG: alginate lyase family protein [bacterium]|nr:alginate lyase family protein [bacterium]
MEDFKRILERVKKNPETIPMKSFRFLKKKYSQLQANKRETKEFLSNEDFKIKTNFKGKESINEQHLFLTAELKDTKNQENAENILKGRYDLLGKQYILTEINWHKDFNSGKVWEKKHFSKIEYDLPYENADKKIPWELNKCQHFVNLALAFEQTKDKRFLEEYKKQTESWIKENTYEIGINWVTPMECAIRAINWIEAYHLFKEELSEDFTLNIAKQLYLHGRFIRNNLEWSPKKENHYLSDIMGLFFIGNFFKEIKETNSWKKFAQKELEKEILKQVSEDGVNYEASLNYHRLVTEIFLLSYILAKRNNNTFSESYKNRLEKMCEFIMYYTPESGKAPAIGDTDNGRILHIWDEDTNDHRDLLAIASVLFHRADFKTLGKFHEKMQLLVSQEEYLKEDLQTFDLDSKAFTDYYLIRNKELFLLIHCGDIGRKGFGGHGHNDQLSFVLSLKEKDYLIDPGTYCYTSDKKTRHLLRSTRYHNTLVVNNKEQNIIQEETPFNMENQTNAFCFQWQSDKIQDIFIGKHFAYAPNIITREIHYEKSKKEITITDRLKEEADIELNFYIHPQRKIRKENNKVIIDEELVIECEFEPFINKCLYSREYGHLGETNCITLKKKGNALLTKIYPLQRKEDSLIKIIHEESPPIKETPKKEEKQITPKKTVKKALKKKEEKNLEEEYY